MIDPFCVATRGLLSGDPVAIATRGYICAQRSTYYGSGGQAGTDSSGPEIQRRKVKLPQQKIDDLIDYDKRKRLEQEDEDLLALIVAAIQAGVIP